MAIPESAMFRSIKVLKNSRYADFLLFFFFNVNSEIHELRMLHEYFDEYTQFSHQSWNRQPCKSRCKRPSGTLKLLNFFITRKLELVRRIIVGIDYGNDWYLEIFRVCTVDDQSEHTECRCVEDDPDHPDETYLTFFNHTKKTLKYCVNSYRRQQMSINQDF